MTTRWREGDSEDQAITLAEACEIEFRNTITPCTLRAQAAKGNLDIFRLGRRDYTTVRSVRQMFKKCRVPGQPRDSISIPDDGNGLSETEQSSSALDALRQTVTALKKPSHDTSDGNTNRNAHRNR